MATKNYGPASSGYLDPTGRNWENPVFQAGKPVLDKELNLVEDLSSGFGQGALRRAMPSGWISDDFLGSSDMTAALFTPTVTPDTLITPNNLVAHVNGWLLNVAYTNSNAHNVLTFPPAPVGAGTKRTDVVILEVWRCLLSASPSTDGKSPLGRIWLNGNVKIDSADDAALNPPDDILDGTLAVESTKRVQIQYRLRVITGVDLDAYPYAMNDPAVVANSVPPNATTPDGVATAFVYTNQSANGDAGLWVAGDGNPLNALGTVDGYVYALPLLGVVRRNRTAFDKDSNHNGGVSIGSGSSDRPDGLYYDVFAARDIVDLRCGVSPVGWNYPEVLARNLGFLLDNTLQMEWTQTLIGGGSAGPTVFTADEIGPKPDTPGANGIGSFDRVRRRFSDRETVEVITLAIDPPAATWTPGDVVTIAPNLLPIYPFAAPIDWSACNPDGGIFLDLRNFRWIGESAGKQTLDATPSVQTVTGLGTQAGSPLGPTSFTITMAGMLPAGVTDERLFVDLVISYPRGLGLINTPTTTWGVSVNPPGLPAGMALTYADFDLPHREVRLQVVESAITITLEADSVILVATTYTLPERARSVSNVLKNGAAIMGGFTLGTDGRLLTFSVETFSPGDRLTITYNPVRPLPETGVKVTLFYDTRAPATTRTALLGAAPLTVIPRHIDNSLYVLTVGSGSQDEAYPYPTAYTQLGGIFPTSVGMFAGDHELAAGAPVYTSEFNASTGFLKMPTYIGYTPNPQEVTFQRVIGDVDIEGRTYFPSVPGGIYPPNAYAQPLTDIKRHRNILPVLAELSADCPMGYKGQLVLVLLLREALADKDNKVVFDPVAASNTTVASVFRIKGNLLNRRA